MSTHSLEDSLSLTESSSLLFEYERYRKHGRYGIIIEPNG